VLAAFLGLALNPIVATARGITYSALARRNRIDDFTLIAAIGAGISMLTQPALAWLHNAPTTIRSLHSQLEHMWRPLEAAGRATQTLVNGHAAQCAIRAAESMGRCD
jgi:hypothetical protein